MSRYDYRPYYPSRAAQRKADRETRAMLGCLFGLVAWGLGLLLALGSLIALGIARVLIWATPRLMDWARRHPRPAAVIGMGLVVTVVVAALLSPAPTPAPAAPVPDPAPVTATVDTGEAP